MNLLQVPLLPAVRRRGRGKRPDLAVTPRPDAPRRWRRKTMGERYRKFVREWAQGEVHRLETAAMKWTLQAEEAVNGERQRLFEFAARARHLARKLRLMRNEVHELRG